MVDVLAVAGFAAIFCLVLYATWGELNRMWPWVLGGLAAFLLMLACVLTLPGHLVAWKERTGEELKPEERLKAENDVRTSLVQGVVGLTLLAGLFFTWQQLRIGQEQLDRTATQAQEQLTLERFTRAMDELGSSQPDVNLGGVYALERILVAEASDDRAVRGQAPHRGAILDILTAYIRRHAPPPPKDAAAVLDRLRQRAVIIQAVLDILNRQVGKDGSNGADDAGHLDLSNVDIRGADLDRARLVGATFVGAHLNFAHLRSAVLDGADFTRAVLVSAQLTSAKLRCVTLSGADQSCAKFIGADLRGVDLSGAELAGARFQGAHLDRGQLRNTVLKDADLTKANLAKADLSGADLSGAAGLEAAVLTGAIADARTRWPPDFDWKDAGVVTG